MATKAYHLEPLDVLLAAIPSLPRAVLSRLTDRLVERLDEIDGDCDREDYDTDLEDNGDREGIDEREPEDVEDGLSDRHLVPAGFITSLNR